MVLLNSDSTVLLSTAYLPPIEFFSSIVRGEKVVVEQFENYVKQSYRNRAKIFASDGVLSLTIPVLNSGNNTPIKDVKIDYSKKWTLQHERALISAYMSSPFFEYYRDDLFRVLEKKHTYLFDKNYELIEVIMEALALPQSYSSKIVLSQEYLPSSSISGHIVDLRETLHPKKDSPIFSNSLSEERRQKPYYQVFAQKYGFISGLSIVDLLFNEGPDSFRYL